MIDRDTYQDKSSVRVKVVITVIEYVYHTGYIHMHGKQESIAVQRVTECGSLRHSEGEIERRWPALPRTRHAL